MKSPAHDLAVYLSTAPQSVGTFGGSSGWSVNVAAEPATPATAITLYDTAGGESDTDELDSMPRFQVRVRGPVFADCYSKQKAIRDLLLLPEPITTAESTYLIQMSGEIESIGRDDSNNYLLVANYRARRAA
jgi:hypothetical protein